MSDKVGFMWRSLVAFVLALALGAPVAAQISQGQTGPAATAGAPGTGMGVAPVSFDYKLGAGDKVRVNVFGEDTLSGEYEVSGEAGVVSMPLIGDVQAGGLTVTQLQTLIEAKLKDGYLKEPHVSIEVLNYRPFYILGEVTKPGEYPYTTGLTVLNAVATANGFTYRADTHKVFIKRAGDPVEHEYPLTSMTLVQPGDTIRVKERFF